ncbi:MAG: (Fe-S)-binding protein [Deltaproteobacteria bacterium]|nr:(Fe-S)-binding protein [Deltaproteobacteria bacterium]MBW1928269.1 (Fe-S)-binding protein [Deltaproteobacteria bacterium]
MEPKYDFERKFRDQVVLCSKCGFCQAVCPVYGATLRPALNARGKMLLLKEVMDRRIELNDELIETLFQCTTCASCAENCPSGVNVPEIIKQVRKDMVNIGSCHPAFKGMNQVLRKYTNIYGEEEPENFDRGRKEKAEVVFFVGCVGLYREDEATESTLDLLDRLGVDYTLVDEVCCSGVLEDVGYRINEDLVRRNIETILSVGARKLVTECPYCWRTFDSRPEYAELKNNIEILHITQFLQDFDFGVTTDKLVTYHDPCDLGRHCGIYEEPREIIKKIALNFVEMPHNRENSLCCGAGGGVRGAYPKNSLAMARRRLQEALDMGADVLLTECNSCVHNLSQAKLRKDKIRIYNTTQFINELMEEME